MCEGDSIMADKKLYSVNKNFLISFFHAVPSLALWFLSAELDGLAAHFLGFCTGVLVATDARLLHPVMHVFQACADYVWWIAGYGTHGTPAGPPVSLLRHDVKPFSPLVDVHIAPEEVEQAEGRGTFQSPRVVKKNM